MGKKKVTSQSTEESLKQQAATDTAVAKTATSGKRSKRVEDGMVYVNATYNNTVVTVTDSKGSVLAWASAGSLGFSGPKKATPFAATKIISALAEKMKATGPMNIQVIVKGVGSGRDSAIRSLINHGFNITSLKDSTPVPFNGPKRPKVRRV